MHTMIYIIQTPEDIIFISYDFILQFNILLETKNKIKKPVISKNQMSQKWGLKPLKRSQSKDIAIF